MEQYIALKTTIFKGHKIKKSKVVPSFLVKSLLERNLCKPKRK